MTIDLQNLTLEDIAQKAGVSRSTVSRVVNEHPNVSEKVRTRVLQVIAETGFHPNAAARTLASQRSSMIGFILGRTVSSFFADPYFPQLTQGIAQACNQNRYTLSLFLVESREDEALIFPTVSRKGLLDGVIVQSGHDDDELINQLIISHIPIVVVGRPFAAENVTFLDVDNVAASHKAVAHLIGLGNTRVATIVGSENTTVGIDRRQGYLDALAEAGLAVDQNLIAAGDFSEESGYQAMQALLPHKPDAVFAASDAMAFGAIRATRHAGLRVPEDIAFVGFDDLPSARRFEPALTTVRQPVSEMGSKAVETLLQVIQEGAASQAVTIVPTELVVRKSCGAQTMGQSQ
jgi:LacI family transcriptional regulator